MHQHLTGNLPDLVKFSSKVANARLPSPILLGLHAACARVLHMSGAAEVIDELDRDVEETRVLAFDGSSACLLDHLMTPFATIPGVAQCPVVVSRCFCGLWDCVHEIHHFQPTCDQV